MAEFESLFSDEEIDALNRFSRTVWGNPQSVLGRIGDIEFIDLKEYFSGFEPLFAGALKHDKILIREEYRAALLALETDLYYPGAYVSGQPGIGKTLSIVYFLVVCLGKKRPVALQLSNGKPYYALFQDSFTYHSLHDRRSLLKCGFVWAISDSNDHVKRPDGIFLGKPKHIRVIQVTSPKTSRWKEWSKQTGACCYVMDIWSEKELADLAILLERFGALSKQDVERMVTLATNWGNVPRTVLRQCRRRETGAVIERNYRLGADHAVRKCRETVYGVPQGIFPVDLPSMFYFVRPLVNNEGIDRSIFSIFVPTRKLRSLLGEALRGQLSTTKLDFFTSMSLSSDTRMTASYIYKSWFHSYFTALKPIECHFVDPLDSVRELRGTAALIPAAKDAPKAHNPSYYWVAPRGLPGIDSALVLSTEIFAFHITISSEHTGPLDGLRMLRSMHDNVKGLPWRVVYIGPDESSIKAVAAQWAGKVSFPGRADHVPVAWSKIDPVDKDVGFELFRDESDPVPKEVMEAIEAMKSTTTDDQ